MASSRPTDKESQKNKSNSEKETIETAARATQELIEFCRDAVGSDKLRLDSNLFYNTMRKIISQGADVNVYNVYRQITPLHIACAFSHKAAVDLLLKAGASYDSVLRDLSNNLAIGSLNANAAQYLVKIGTPFTKEAVENLKKQNQHTATEFDEPIMLELAKRFREALKSETLSEVTKPGNQDSPERMIPLPIAGGHIALLEGILDYAHDDELSMEQINSLQKRVQIEYLKQLNNTVDFGDKEIAQMQTICDSIYNYECTNLDAFYKILSNKIKNDDERIDLNIPVLNQAQSYAVNFNDFKTLSFLIKHGDINLNKDKDDITCPLSIAIRQAINSTNKHMVDYLIANRAEINFDNWKKLRDHAKFKPIIEKLIAQVKLSDSESKNVNIDSIDFLRRINQAQRVKPLDQNYLNFIIHMNELSTYLEIREKEGSSRFNSLTFGLFSNPEDYKIRKQIYDDLEKTSDFSEKLKIIDATFDQTTKGRWSGRAADILKNLKADITEILKTKPVQQSSYMMKS